MKIINREFISYKFFNSISLGVSVGSIFAIYTPLQPSIYSIGGILLALGMLFVAKFYSKILNIQYFYKISFLVEFIMLAIILFFLFSSYSYFTALFVYIGYQVTFTFGSYLVRAETLLLKRSAILTFLDVAKQKGYLWGMFLSFVFYKIIEEFFSIHTNQEQVYLLHYFLLLIEFIILFKLYKSFQK